MARRAIKRKPQRAKRLGLKKKQQFDSYRLVPWAVGIFVVAVIAVSVSSPTGQFSATMDSDSDGLSDAQEQIYGSSVINSDTDGDGCLDGAEVYLYCTDILTADCDPAVTPTCDIR